MAVLVTVGARLEYVTKQNSDHVVKLSMHREIQFKHIHLFVYTKCFVCFAH